jgi:nucleotide-binding universal stress UspA family protein
VAAFRIGHELGRPVQLLHAAEVPHPLWQHVDELGISRARDETLARLGRLLDGESLRPADLDQALTVVPGPAAKAILEQAGKVGASLIVLGRHERHGLLHFGDTVRAVLARAECPVLTQAGPPRQIRRILVALDLSEESSKALELARDWGLALRAEVTALHCFLRPELGFVLGYPVPFPSAVVDQARETDEAEFRRHLEPFEWKGVAHRQVFVEADPATEILERQEATDLIVMGTHGRTGLSGAILGSVAASVLREAQRPVLALRAGEREWLT